jgi:hypothetical protein
MPRTRRVASAIRSGVAGALLAAVLGCSCRSEPLRPAGMPVASPTVAPIAPPPSPLAVEPAGAVEPREALPCFGGEVTAAGPALELSLTASRLRGTAPLAVVFETVGTKAEATSRPFHELGYCWDFGDASSGTYRTTGLAKNQAKGPIAAHVFEAPGRYAVTVSAADARGRVASRTLTVEVDDPERTFAGDATTCLSDTADFAGCPVGAKHVQGAALGALANSVRSGARLLLRRGGRFTGSLTLNVPGPGFVGAFGPSSAPLPLVTTPKGPAFAISGETPSFSDWRIADLEITGTDKSKAVEVGGTARDLLLLRLNAHDLLGCVIAGDSIIDYWRSKGRPNQDVTDVLVVADSTFTRSVGGGNLAYTAAHRLVYLGNVFSNSLKGEHLVRTPWIDRGVFSHNDLGMAPAPRHLVKIHAPEFGVGGVGFQRYTEQVVISDNVFRSDGGHQWSVAIAPQNALYDERLRDVLVERNLFLPGPQAQAALVLSARSVTVRDNLMNRGPQGACVSVMKRSKEPPPEGITLINNTCFSTADAGPKLLAVDATATNVRAFGNLIVGPHAGEAGLPAGAKALGNMALTESPFAAGELLRHSDFALRAGSLPVDAGDPQHFSPWDFSGRPRPLDGNGDGTRAPDVGGLESSPR